MLHAVLSWFSQHRHNNFLRCPVKCLCVWLPQYLTWVYLLCRKNIAHQKKSEREDLLFDLKSQTHRMFRIGRDPKDHLILPGAFQFALKFSSLGPANILASTSPLGIEKWIDSRYIFCNTAFNQNLLLKCFSPSLLEMLPSLFRNMFFTYHNINFVRELLLSITDIQDFNCHIVYKSEPAVRC